MQAAAQLNFCGPETITFCQILGSSLKGNFKRHRGKRTGYMSPSRAMVRVPLAGLGPGMLNYSGMVRSDKVY